MSSKTDISLSVKMSSANGGEPTRSEELDTIQLFAIESEPTESWLSTASCNKTLRRGSHRYCTSNDALNAAHTSVDIDEDATTKQLDLEKESRNNDASNTSNNRKVVEVAQKEDDVNTFQKDEADTSEGSCSIATSAASIDEEGKRQPMDTNATCGGSTTGEGGGGPDNNDPVVAEIRGKRGGRSCSRFNCSYFGYLTGIMKIVEVITLLIALIVTVTVGGTCYYSGSLILVNGVMLMGLTVTPTLLVCYLLQQTHIRKTLFEVMINGFMALYSVVAGCSVMGCSAHSSDSTLGVVLGLFLLVAGLAYGVDCVLAIIKYKD